MAIAGDLPVVQRIAAVVGAVAAQDLVAIQIVPVFVSLRLRGQDIDSQAVRSLADRNSQSTSRFLRSFQQHLRGHHDLPPQGLEMLTRSRCRPGRSSPWVGRIGSHQRPSRAPRGSSAGGDRQRDGNASGRPGPCSRTAGAAHTRHRFWKRLLVASCGCVLVISANPALTLGEISRANTGQSGPTRAAGIGTLSGALFFRGLATPDGANAAPLGCSDGSGAGLGLIGPSKCRIHGPEHRAAPK